MPWTEPITTTLPGNQVEILRTMVATGHAISISAWIAAAVAEQLAARGLLPHTDPPTRAM